MDNILIITVLTIFATAFIGTIIKYRLRDKCLRDFRGYLVNAEHLDGRVIKGQLQVYHNGLELIHPTPISATDDAAHQEISTLIFQPQMNTLRALKRYHDELSPENQARRSKEVARAYHPGPFRRLWRRLRNLFNLLRDAFGQALSLFIGAFKSRGTSTLLATQDTRINATAQQIIAQGAAAYEPMLERYIGHYVVLEITHNGETQKNVGVLKEYSDAYLTVLNVAVDSGRYMDLIVPRSIGVIRHGAQITESGATTPAAE